MIHVPLSKLQVNFSKPSVVTLGNFDGIHLGHRELLEKTRQIALEKNFHSVLVTYFPSPTEYFQKKNVTYLTTQREKEFWCKKFGIEVPISLQFDEELVETHAEEFLEKILLEKLHAKHIVIGFDHRFGKNREGSSEFLEFYANKKGYAVTVIPAKILNGKKISSTEIRNSITSGNLVEASAMLGRPYSLLGTVLRGDQRGRTIGFPTANLSLPSEKLLPSLGVYAGILWVQNQMFPGIANLGKVETLNKQDVQLEVHALDFSQEIYGEEVLFEFHHKLRDTQKFSGLDELKNQIARDKEEAIHLLKNVKA